MKLMHAVAVAIKEDLGSVKDVLDMFVRTGMENVTDLEPQLEMLKKISDTLGVLGLVAARDEIQRESKALETIVASQRAPEEAELEQMAATLLDIEDALDSELVRAATPSGEREEPASDDSMVQLRQATQSVIGECIVNLARIKEAVVELVERPGDVRALDQVGPQLRGITARADDARKGAGCFCRGANRCSHLLVGWHRERRRLRQTSQSVSQTPS